MIIGILLFLAFEAVVLLATAGVLDHLYRRGNINIGPGDIVKLVATSLGYEHGFQCEIRRGIFNHRLGYVGSLIRPHETLSLLYIGWKQSRSYAPRWLEAIERKVEARRFRKEHEAFKARLQELRNEYSKEVQPLVEARTIQWLPTSPNVNPDPVPTPDPDIPVGDSVRVHVPEDSSHGSIGTVVAFDSSKDSPYEVKFERNSFCGPQTWRGNYTRNELVHRVDPQDEEDDEPNADDGDEANNESSRSDLRNGDQVRISEDLTHENGYSGFSPGAVGTLEETEEDHPGAFPYRVRLPDGSSSLHSRNELTLVRPKLREGDRVAITNDVRGCGVQPGGTGVITRVHDVEAYPYPVRVKHLDGSTANYDVSELTRTQ